MSRRLLVLVVAVLLAGCIEKAPRELKSPCVANENWFGKSSAPAPCARRKPQDNWLV